LIKIRLAAPLSRAGFISFPLVMNTSSKYPTSMQIPLVMTIIGKDKPGLVESVATLVAENGGNWLESRMSRLGGQFAGILRVTVPSEKEELLSKSLSGLKSRGLMITIQRDEEHKAESEEQCAELSLVGQDRPGIVRQISQTLARFGINVEELETECASAPMSGETLFHANARVFIPTNCPADKLRRELEKIAADLMVEIKWNEILE
jgi:glycine cleavage system regulatory protein